MRISDWSSDVCSSDLIYEFWPTLSERCVRGEIEFACHPCEPDLLIKLHKVDGKRLYVLIEAKHLSGKSSGPSEDLTAPYDQLAREWDNLVCRCKKDEEEPLLIFLTADFNAQVEQISESAAEYSRKIGSASCRERVCQYV